MKARATVRLKFPSDKHQETILKALNPEIKKPASLRSSARLEKEGMFLVLKVKARDTVALRATLNAYLRWMNSMINALDVLEAHV